jgi:hypothetical protein
MDLMVMVTVMVTLCWMVMVFVTRNDETTCYC